MFGNYQHDNQYNPWEGFECGTHQDNTMISEGNHLLYSSHLSYSLRQLSLPNLIAVAGTFS